MPRSLSFFVALSLVSLLAALAPRQARAGEIPCQPVDDGVVFIDGVLSDWRDAPGLDIGGDGDDFAFTVKCSYDRDSLYLMVDVEDDVLARAGGRSRGRPTGRPATKAAKMGARVIHRPVGHAPKKRVAHVKVKLKVKGGLKAKAMGGGAIVSGSPEDHVEFVFGDDATIDRFVVYPGDARSDIPRKAYWSSGKPVAKDIEVADAAQEQGWAVEMKIPLKSVLGYSPGAPGLHLAAAAYDNDSPQKPHIEKVLATGPTDKPDRLGYSMFAEAHALFEAFMRDRRFADKDVTFDRVGRILPSGQARAVLAKSTLAILSDEYFYIELPVKSPRDISDVRLADLGGEGQQSIVLRYRESSANGWRELLAAYRMSGEGLHRAFAVEIGRGRGNDKLQARAQLVPRKGGRGIDVVVEPLPAVGYTEANYRDAPAEDVAPIPLPWGPDKRVRYTFHGDEYSRAE